MPVPPRHRRQPSGLDTAQAGLFGDAAAAAPYSPQALPGGRVATAYNLFFGSFAVSPDAKPLAAKAAALCEQQGLRGPTPQTAARLHVTLSAVRKTVPFVEADVVQACLAAGDSLDWRDLALTFRSAGGFKNAVDPTRSAYVLRCDEPSRRRLFEFFAGLSTALRRHGVRHDSLQTPHMTMAYGQPVAEHPIVPIEWTATGFALVLSHVGQTHHEFIRRWPAATMAN